jgi:hypothetical protein
MPIELETTIITVIVAFIVGLLITVKWLLSLRE